jgi:peptidoglycan/LPS O-acetylase OafA/YrhL
MFYSKKLASPELASTSHEAQPKPHFYRAELDALRFFAFISVFLHHSPGIYPGAHAPFWKVFLADLFLLTRSAGGFGMSLFFVLSSYLITELLLREKRASGEVHLISFYARRILRIWPLYFLAVGLAVVLGALIPNDYAMNPRALFAFLIFAVAWFPGGIQTPFNVLWSIGIEEQFYLIWPMLAKLGGTYAIRLASLVVIVVSFLTLITFASTGGSLWYNPFVEFLFFAVGALLSIGLHGRTWNVHMGSRWLLFGAGVVTWLLAEHIGHISNPLRAPPAWRDCVGYSFSAIGCVLIFLSFLGIAQHAISNGLLYLGKISYGLYVFHTTALALTMRWLPPFSYSALWWVVAVDAIALLLTISIAALSYKYFEKPFLRFKRRFEFVYSRVS